MSTKGDEGPMRRVFALIRFSFLSTDSGYRLTKGLTIEEKKAALFSGPRMEARFSLFEHLCLPSLAVQPPEIFGAVVLASDYLPDRYKERLFTLLQPHPNLLPVFKQPMSLPYSGAFLEGISRIGAARGVLMTCRLDDDDAVAADFAQRALSYVHDGHEGFCLTFPRGLHVAPVDREPRFWELQYPLHGAGLGYIHLAEAGKTIFDCGHHQRIWEKFPTIVDGSSPQYLISCHEANDSMSGDNDTAEAWWKRLFRSSSGVGRHRNELRNPPDATLSLAEAEERFGSRFPSLSVKEWSFL